MGSFLNTLKTTMLLALLTALCLWAGSSFGGTTGLVIAGAFVLIMNFASFWWSHKIILWMYKAKELPKSDKIARLVHELARKDGLPPPKVYLMENATPNAFATGPTYKRAAVAVTTSLVQLLDEQELRGVIAHELTHVKNRDTLIQTIAATIAGVIAYLAAIARWGAIFGLGGDRDRGSLLSFLVLAIVAPLAAMILQLALSRTREYAADEGAARLLRDKEGLARALQKLERGNAARPMQDGNPSTSSLFIVNPFRGSFLIELLSTHPRTEKRVARLKGLAL